MAIYKRGKIYWYKFVWQGELVRESTKQGNDKVARQIEAAHRTRLAKEKDQRQAAASSLNCDAVLLCRECGKWFDAPSVVLDGNRQLFCSNLCRVNWKKKHTIVPLLSDFCGERFEPWYWLSTMYHTERWRTISASRSGQHTVSVRHDPDQGFVKTHRSAIRKMAEERIRFGPSSRSQS